MVPQSVVRIDALRRLLVQNQIKVLQVVFESSATLQLNSLSYFAFDPHQYLATCNPGCGDSLHSPTPELQFEPGPSLFALVRWELLLVVHKSDKNHVPARYARDRMAADR